MVIFNQTSGATNSSFEILIFDIAAASNYVPRSVHDIMTGNVIAKLEWWDVINLTKVNQS